MIRRMFWQQPTLFCEAGFDLVGLSAMHGRNRTCLFQGMVDAWYVFVNAHVALHEKHVLSQMDTWKAPYFVIDLNSEDQVTVARETLINTMYVIRTLSSDRPAHVLTPVAPVTMSVMKIIQEKP